MVNPESGIAYLVSNLKKAIKRGTMIPPPPIPAILAIANKNVSTNTPTTS